MVVVFRKIPIYLKLSKFAIEFQTSNIANVPNIDNKNVLFNIANVPNIDNKNVLFIAVCL